MKRKIANAFSAAKSNDFGWRDRNRPYSCYEGGKKGTCAQCELLKASCTCQRCTRCNRFLITLHSRCHCRVCWRSFCPSCTTKMRVNGFTEDCRPQPSRTCVVCALPQGLLHVSALFDSYGRLHTDAAPAAAAAAAAAAGDVGPQPDGVGAEVGESGVFGIGDAGARFPWGLYALLCAVDAPRRCINPGCACEFTYDAVCRRCKVPAVTTAMHAIRSVATAAPSSSSSSAKVDAGLVAAIEEGVGHRHDTAAAALTVADMDAVYAAVLPSGADGFALHGLRDSVFAVRKVLLSRIAAAVAMEWHNCPHISLAMFGSPEARLLRLVRAGPLFSAFECPGTTRIIAFTPAAGRRSLERRPTNAVRTRRVWAAADGRAIGVVEREDQPAAAGGDGAAVGEFTCSEAVLREVEERKELQAVALEATALMREGVDVVLCGFSTGGAIAAHIAARLLIEETEVAASRLLCVTFGAPLTAGRGLTALLESSPRGNLCRNFQHFVYGSDVVPRLSFLSEYLGAGTLGAPCGAGGAAEMNAAEVRDRIVSWLRTHATASENPPTPGEERRKGRGGKGRRKQQQASMKGRKSAAASSSDLCSDSGGNGGASTTGTTSSRSSSCSSTGSGGDDDVDVGPVGDDAAAAAGDIFAHTREPFDNNRDSMRPTLTATGEVGSPALQTADRSAFETAEYRNAQLLDPFGCYHFLFRGQDMYCYSEDPAATLGLLTDRSAMRVLLRHHHMSTYNEGIVEYFSGTA